MPADGTRACRANLLKDRKALSAIPGIKKAFVNFLIETLLLFVLLPRKANFTQIEIYGNYCEKTLRKNFSKSFTWIDFNIELGNHLFQTSSRKAIAIDPSYISKSGKLTQGASSLSSTVWRFWA